MSLSPGPKKQKNSLKSIAVKKSFYIKNDNWRVLENYSELNNESKSFLINEALENYFVDLIKGSFEPKENHWSVISLFSGCGGMDLGFEGGFDFLGTHYQKNRSSSSQFEVVFANDIMASACNDYRNYFAKKNNKEPYVINDDIKNFLDGIESLPVEDRGKLFPHECDVVIGGFPCQDFSLAGKRKGLKAERGQLYLQMKRVIELTKPKLFIAENVKGLTNLAGALDKIKEDFSKTGKGYKIFHKLHMAADFGVPQTRERVFICGIRNDLDDSVFRFPLETHSIEPDDTGLKPWVSAHEALKDVSGNDHLKNTDQFSKARNYGAHLQGNKAIRSDAPSPTIRAEHHGNIEFHYELERRLSIRECARLQTFPDDYEFISSTSKSYVELGNAVPPVLAWHIANSVGDALEKWG